MNQNMFRTDLAVEAHDRVSQQNNKEINGVKYSKNTDHGIKSEIIEVVNKDGEKALGKPKGKYITIEMDAILHREAHEFEDCVSAVSSVIKEVAGGLENKRVLVAGLGNDSITPDCIGVSTVKNTLVTGHLKRLAKDDFKFFGDVYVIMPGVMGTTGIESAVYIKHLCNAINPDVVILIDSLAASSIDRLCRTVQITDTGISPGAGVGNNRTQINKDYLGVPTVAIGVPTVVDLATIYNEYNCKNTSNKSSSMIVTSRGIDEEVKCAGRILGYAVNLAVHEGLSVADVDMFLG